MNKEEMVSEEVTMGSMVSKGRLGKRYYNEGVSLVVSGKGVEEARLYIKKEGT